MSRPQGSEPTEAGAQCLMPGVRPISRRERLERLMAAPLTPLRPQQPLDIGLFDEAARRQGDLFDRPSPAPAPDLPPKSG